MSTTAEILTNNIYLKKSCRKKKAGRTLILPKTEKEPLSEEIVYCRACGMAITSTDQAFAVNSSFSHTFFNPAGIVYELGCYKTASGAYVAGPPSSEFSWFAGHLWTIALCSQCNAHLGWHFSSGPTSFWGLILKNLKE